MTNFKPMMKKSNNLNNISSMYLVINKTPTNSGDFIEKRFNYFCKNAFTALRPKAGSSVNTPSTPALKKI